MKKLLLVFSLILIGISLVEAETVTYTEFTEQIDYGNGKHKLVSGVSNLKNEEGEWKPFSDVAKVQYQDYKIRFSFREYWVEYEPYVIYNGNKFTLEWIINNFNGVGQHIDVNKNRNSYKWALTVSGIPTNLKEGAEYLGFDYIDSNNLQWSDIRIDKNSYAVIIKETVVLSYFDLVWHEYCLDANKETVRIGCLNHDYNYHGQIINHWQQDEQGLWSITFDPTYSSTSGQSSDDAQTSGSGEDYDDDDEFYYIAHTVQPKRQGWIFQQVNIPQGTVIDDANITFETWATCAAGSCKLNIYGFDVDDADTWKSGVNEPIDAPWTDANTYYQTSGSDTANGASTTRKFNVKEQTQEILDRGGWVQDNNMGFITDDNGSTGRNKSIKAWTYDNTAGIPKPLLEIEWTVIIDFSFSFSYPASGCSDGKGCTGGGCSACTYAYFEPIDLTGTSTETEVNPYGQTSTLAFIVVDNQSIGSNDFNMSIDLNAPAPSGAGWFIKLKLSTITDGWESTCSEDALTGCILVNDANKNIGIINYSASAQDKNFFFFSDFQSVHISSYNRDGSFYSYGTT